MTLLAIDTSTPSTVVAVGSDNGDVLASRRHDPEGRERPQHTTLGLALANQALAEAGTDWNELTRIGVGIGPGSFTGLRSGISAATALAQRLGVGVVALRGPELLAAGADAGERAVLAVIDARRKELFVELLRGGDGGGLRVVGLAEVDGLADAAGALAVGDGAVLVAAAMARAGADVPPAGDPRHRIGPVALAALTAAGTTLAPSELRPEYGRAPDAVPTAERQR